MQASDRRKRVAEEAAEWWVLLQGDVSRAQREQYVDWLRESSAHVAEMLHVAQVHGALEQFQRWSDIPVDGSREGHENILTLPSALCHREAQPGRSERRSRWPFVWATAAALLVVTSTAAVLLLSRGNLIQTDRGERREVALADGSVVQVDPQTRLRIKYQDHARRVFLEHGRALFHVAKNTERPFLVESNNTTVRAVGTAFAVEQQDNESVLVTVAEGKVAVFPTRDLAPEPVPSSPPARVETDTKELTEVPVRPSSSIFSSIETSRRTGESVPERLANGVAPAIFLTANQQVSVARSGSAEAVRSVDSGRALAWAGGRLIFENTSVGDAVQLFNRYNRIQLVVSDAELASRPISGVFNAADPESFVAFLQSVARIRVTHSDDADITIDAAQ